MKSDNIKYFKNEQIDKVRWDKLIDEALNGRVYAYSWYLDTLSKHWDALILGDYEAVMPLPCGVKFGMHYIVNPIYVQQLGVFSASDDVLNYYPCFFKNIPSRYRYIDLSVNLPAEVRLKGFQTKIKTNFILDIDRSYDEIRAAYRSDAKKKLQKEKDECFYYSEGIAISPLISDYKKYNGPMISGLKESDFSNLEKVLSLAQQKGNLITAHVADSQSATLASGLFLTSHERAYYIVGSQTEKGREKYASHFLLDGFFREHAQQFKVFDFEGSDIPGVASFFKKWGSVPEYYTNLKMARFPVNFFLSL